MKPSLFNFTYTRFDGSFVVFNTFSKAVFDFDSEEKYNEIIKRCCDSSQTSHAPCEEEKTLTENGILVTDETDELTILKYFHYKAKFSKEHLILTIAPTMQCNFACPYCYETAHDGSMSQQVQDAIIEYVIAKIQDGVKDIDLTWYGGEPLLYPEVIDKVSSRISEIAQQEGIKVHYTMVTNGSLLTIDIVNMLVRNKINSIQITIDGMADNHNVRRPFRGGQGSFDRIIADLSLFVNSGIRVNIRMNVDNQNKNDYSSLCQLIAKLRPQVDIAVYPALVEHLNANDNRSDIYLTGEEYADFMSECYGDKRLDADSMAVAQNRRYFCTAELENCYVIDEKGNFYKCWDEIGRPEMICFNVLNQSEVNYSSIVRYVADDPFSEGSKCISCCFLPLCFGGCRYQKYYFGNTKCSFTKAGMIDYVEKKYFHQL